MIRDGLTLQAADIKQLDVVLEVGAIPQSGGERRRPL